MQQLKYALIKAGLAKKEFPDKKKEEVRLRPQKSKAPKKEFKKYDEHQIRTICEVCNNTTPDVEYYRHNNRLIVKRWLCIKCADDAKIADDLRETNQSSYSRTGRFHRMWGKTKQF